MAESILRIKSKQFAIDIIHACREMRKNKVEYCYISIKQETEKRGT